MAEMSIGDLVKLTNTMSDKILARRPKITENLAYYRGEEGRMRFASDEFRDYFAKRFAGFTDNWVAPVADAPIERIRHLGIRLPGQTRADDGLARVWDANEASRGLSEALLVMTVARRSFALVSPLPGGLPPRITFEHPDAACVLYDPVTRARRAGMVMWADEEWEYGEVYTPQWVIPMKRKAAMRSRDDRRQAPDLPGWSIDLEKDTRRNPLGAVPLVELRNKTLLDDDPISDTEGTAAMQDSINLVWAYLLNSLDYASLPARVVMGIDTPMEPILDQDGQEIGARPVELDRFVRDRVIFLPGEGGSVGEWSAANLEAFSNVIEHGVEHVAAQTRTPGHYLFSKSNVPATGYELAEAGLVSKTAERIEYAAPAVREIYRLVALAQGETVKAAQIALGRTLWRKPQYRTEAHLLDGLAKMRQVGFPFQWIAEEYGLEPTEVARVVEMKRREERESLDALGGFPGNDGAGAENGGEVAEDAADAPLER